MPLGFSKCCNILAICILNLLLVFSFTTSSGQSIDKIINATEVERIETVLSSDAMEGRKTFTPAIDRAADFIRDEFNKAGLQYFSGLSSFRQDFSMIKTKLISSEATFDGLPIDPKNIITVTTARELLIDNNSGFEKVHISSAANLLREATKYAQSARNYLVLVDTSFASNFSRLARLTRESFKRNNTVLFVLSPSDPVTYKFSIKNELTESKLANVVGIIPGKSLPNEYVIFSAHYDHLGIGKPNDKNDSIYNGANDDAAGTTAIILLSRYFKNLKNNARTIVFAAFTAEEIGGFGSRYFSQQIDPEKVVAMFNIEMIGTESKWGTNSAYITGYDKSDFGKILQANLADSKFHFEPDPYPQQNLFMRSDNATLAALGVPAHTISTSKMDSEKYYHTQGDDISTLDMNNMAEIIKAIALSSVTIVSGKDTPTRIPRIK